MLVFHLRHNIENEPYVSCRPRSFWPYKWSVHLITGPCIACGGEAKASASYEFSYDNNDYVIWAACGLEIGGKQLTRISCQRFQNVSLSICWENIGKKAPGWPTQRGVMNFFDAKKVSSTLQRVLFNTCCREAL